MSDRPVTEASITDFRLTLADHLHTVQTHRGIVYVTNRGRRIAALVPVADADQLLNPPD